MVESGFLADQIRVILTRIRNPAAARHEVRLEVEEILVHPEYRDPAYSLDKDGPKIFRLEESMINWIYGK